MDIFPTKQDNEKNFKEFSDNMNLLTNSLDNTITLFDNTIVKSESIELNGFSNNDAVEIDKSVTSIWYSDFDGMNKLITTSTSDDWKVVKDSTDVYNIII